jgi:hypothetical protein
MKKLLAQGVAAAVLLAPMSVDAGCSLADLAGTWRFMSVGMSGGDSDLVPETIDKDNCQMVFNTRGRLTKMTCNPEDGYLGDPTELWVPQSYAQIGRNCWVKVFLRDINVEGVELDGHMTSGKEVISGHGEYVDNWAPLQFTMVRQSR